MSMMRCEFCSLHIDTDYDVDCFVEDMCVCESCQVDLVRTGEILDLDGELKWAPLPADRATAPSVEAQS